MSEHELKKIEGDQLYINLPTKLKNRYLFKEKSKIKLKNTKFYFAAIL